MSQENKPVKMTGAQIVIECLLEQNVDVIFGYPGGTILNIYDALFDYSDRIRHILTAHEQGAAHAADGYARATGKTGVAFATSGPGAANLITGIATAYMDSSPVVFITANVAYHLLGKDSFQEMDITGITMPITKCNYQVHDVEKLADIMREAFAVAESGRKGPVLIDIMKNVTAERTFYTPLEKSFHKDSGHLGSLYKRNCSVVVMPEPDQDHIDEMVNMIRQAERPMIITGGGAIAAGASEELKKLAEKLDAPVASTLMGLGGFPSDHPLFTGLLGMHGTRYSNITCINCDLLITVGTRLNDRVALNPSRFIDAKKLIQIDIDNSELNKNVVADLTLLGDAKKILKQVNHQLEQDPQRENTWFKKYAPEIPLYGANTGKNFTAPNVLNSVSKITDGNVLMVTDVGQHQMWTAQTFPYKFPRQLITSGGFGTMGFGMGAAMGAKIGRPDMTVVEITGDGCFRMNSNELSTTQYYDIPIITIILNNGTLGMVRQWQTLMFKKRYSQTTLDRGPDFVKLAEAYGIRGYQVDNLEDFEKAFSEAYKSGESAVIDCTIEMDDKVTPMVPTGNHLSEFLID
ncbi:MAG: biosynthetic-type acetolactate synthase large subunit [Chloroflexi bacterium]|nr:biosynthetic-type acetolactate synthase large subunit [Chloroflexota bacterium]